MNPGHFIEGHLWVEQLGWTLIHFLWQGVLIAAAYGAVRRWLGPGCSPNVRYVLGCIALATMVTVPLATFGLMRSMTGPSENAQPAARLARVPVGAPAAGAGDTLFESFGIAVGTEHASLLGWVVLLWLAGAMVFWVRLVVGWTIAVRLRAVQVRQAPSEWQDSLRRLGARIGLSRPVQLLVSARVHVPIVLGWLRPVVLMPIGALTGLPAEQVEALLIHELAHIRRHDYLVNILQNIAEALLFYHPVVWWVSGHIRNERELCCDDVVVSVGGDVLTYAHALTELESYRPAFLNVAMGANSGSLENRIARLLGDSRPTSRIRPGSGVLVTTFLLGITAFEVFGQSPSSPRFEVASVKPDFIQDTRMTGNVRALPGGRLTAEKATLQFLIMRAYGVRRYQISGGPDWIDSSGYDIEAKAEGNASAQQVWIMLQSLLEDRFKLKVHRETKEITVYELTVAKSGHMLQPPKEGSCFTPNQDTPGPPPPIAPGQQPPVPCGSAIVSFHSGPQGQFQGQFDARHASMAALASTLSNMLGRTIIDKTGFTEILDAHMEFAPDESLAGMPGPGFKAPSDPGGPATIFTAIQEQLGLKLDSAKGPVEVLVIDSAEKPTEN